MQLRDLKWRRSYILLIPPLSPLGKPTQHHPGVTVMALPTAIPEPRLHYKHCQSTSHLQTPPVPSGPGFMPYSALLLEISYEWTFFCRGGESLLSPSASSMVVTELFLSFIVNTMKLYITPLLRIWIPVIHSFGQKFDNRNFISHSNICMHTYTAHTVVTETLTYFNPHFFCTRPLQWAFPVPRNTIQIRAF